MGDSNIYPLSPILPLEWAPHRLPDLPTISHDQLDVSSSLRPPTRPEAQRAFTNAATADGCSSNERDAALPVMDDDCTSICSSSSSDAGPAVSRAADASRASFTMQIPSCLHLSAEEEVLLASAMRHPPVTTSTLSELDLMWIMQNIHLRCDINYDHDLHFMPVKGQRGEEKRKNALDYWRALSLEFRIFQHNPSHCGACPTTATFSARLPGMFQDLKDLLELLVPDRDHDQVHDHLDVDLLMQQVSHGVLDIVKLSRWLATLLKSHCAPMRDEWAERMADLMTEGAISGDNTKLLAGIERLFSFLEAMKLDVANHQIRSFRSVLIDQTVCFQQTYFRKRIMAGRLDVRDAQRWFRDSRPPLQTNSHVSSQSFLCALTRLCTSDVVDADIPTTLQFDSHRLQQWQDAMQEVVFLNICMKVFHRITAKLCGWSCVSALAFRQLRWRLLTLVTGDPSRPVADVWHDHLEALSLEITRAAYELCCSPGHEIPATEVCVANEDLRTAFRESYLDEEMQAFKQLEQAVLRNAAVFEGMTPLMMSEAQQQWQQDRQRVPEFRNMPDLEDIARKLAHMGVVHWLVWAELAYLSGTAEGTADAGRSRADVTYCTELEDMVTSPEGSGHNDEATDDDDDNDHSPKAKRKSRTEHSLG